MFWSKFYQFKSSANVVYFVYIFVFRLSLSNDFMMRCELVTCNLMPFFLFPRAHYGLVEYRHQHLKRLCWMNFSLAPNAKLGKYSLLLFIPCLCVVCVCASIELNWINLALLQFWTERKNTWVSSFKHTHSKPNCIRIPVERCTKPPFENVWFFQEKFFWPFGKEWIFSLVRRNVSDLHFAICFLTLSRTVNRKYENGMLNILLKFRITIGIAITYGKKPKGDRIEKN